MNHTVEKQNLNKVYYVRGSGLIPIPQDMVPKIPELRKEYHEQEVRNAVLLARYRRMV